VDAERDKLTTGVGQTELTALAMVSVNGEILPQVSV